MMLFVVACNDSSPARPIVPDDASPEANSSPQSPGPAAATDRRERTSSYTKLSEATCKLVDEGEEGPYWLRRCAGPDGWAIEWGESDLRHGLVLISADGKEADLELSDKVANGAFNILGPVIEWRGTRGQPADVLIVRMDVTDNANPERPPKSRLAVAKLGPTLCLIAIVDPAPGQNEKARAIADGALPACLTN